MIAFGPLKASLKNYQGKSFKKNKLFHLLNLILSLVKSIQPRIVAKDSMGVTNCSKMDESIKSIQVNIH